MLEHQHWGLQMPNVRRIWHFKPQSTQIWNCKTQVLQFFLQYCYNAILKVELHCSSIVNIYIYIYIYLAAFPWNFSLLSLIIYVLFSLFLLSFSSCSLLSSNPNTILLPTSTSHIIVEEMLMLWLTRLGSIIFFFFFSCCDAMILANWSWPRLINNGGNIDLAAAMAMMSGFW